MRSCPRFGRFTMNKGCEYENSARGLSCTPQGDAVRQWGPPITTVNTCQDLECKSMSFPGGLRWRLLTPVRIGDHIELGQVSMLNDPLMLLDSEADGAELAHGSLDHGRACSG